MATAQATSDPHLGFPAKGSLKRVPFPRLVREIARNELSGSLYLLSGQTKKVVFFEAGKPVFVRSNVLSECLGQILSQEGLITAEQCEQTLEAIRRTGKKQGELLVEMGILSQGNLRYGLEAQLRAKLFDIFAWEDGRYQFKADDVQESFGVRLTLSAAGVIVGAIQDRYGEERAHKHLAAAGVMGKYLVLRELDEAPELDLLSEELHFARCLDGSRTVAQVLAEPAVPPVPTPTALVLGLLQSGMADAVEEIQPARPRPAPPRLAPEGPPDHALVPSFAPQDVVTEYEDTPLPGELPKVRGLLGQHEDAFADVDAAVNATVQPMRASGGAAFSADLLSAEPESIEETFDDDQIELHPDEDLVEDFDDLELVDEASPSRTGRTAPLDPHALRPELVDPVPPIDVVEEVGPPAHAMANGVAHRGGYPTAARAPGQPPFVDPGLLEADDDLLLPEELDEVDLEGPIQELDVEEVADSELVGLDELDEVELEPVELGAANKPGHDTQNPEILGAIRFNEAEAAMSEHDYRRVVTLLEQAYENGFDVAELHAMLAYARFMAAGGDRATAKHALALLEYAQNMDASLDLVHAYRGAIYQAMQQPQQAREALGRALELNPYCQLAIELMARM